MSSIRIEMENVMKTIFMPGCGVKREYPEEVNKTLEYLKKHFEDVSLYETCCKMPGEKLKADIFIYSCFGCLPRMEAADTATEYYSIYEVFDKYGMPVEAKEGNKEITLGVHECSKLKDDQVNKDLLRSILTRLGYQVEDMQVISDEYDKCAKVLMLEDKENGQEVLEKSLRDYQSKTIVSMCKGCVANIEQTSKDSTHLFEQIFK